MKALTAQNQVRLGLARCFRLALSGMSHRLFRASVTISILALAVAFLSHMLTFSVVERETQRNAWNELRASRMLGEIVSRLNNPDRPRAIVDGLAGEDARRLREYRVWSRLPPPEFDRARAAARTFERFEAYLLKTNPAQRAALFGDQTAEEACARLADPAELGHFLDQLTSFGARVPLGTVGELKSFLFSERPALEAAVDAIARGHAGAIAELEAKLGNPVGKSGPDSRRGGLFENPPPGLLASAQDEGFDISAWSLPALQAFALRARDRARLERAMVGGPRAELGRELDLPASDLSLSRLLGYVDSAEDHAASVSAVLVNNGEPGFDAPRLAALARDFVRAERVERAAGNELQGTNAWFGISERNLWLVLLSFLVCGVGVANAMLMSVGERFAEIATMKCLGALDGFVMTLFLFEAAIQGLIGGVIGLLLGGLLALGRSLAEYGSLLGSAHGALGPVALALGAALALGVLLAALSAVGPSFVAARLSPMEAMRVD